MRYPQLVAFQRRVGQITVGEALGAVDHDTLTGQTLEFVGKSPDVRYYYRIRLSARFLNVEHRAKRVRVAFYRVMKKLRLLFGGGQVGRRPEIPE
jgi:hypothetical protein